MSSDRVGIYWRLACSSPGNTFHAGRSFAASAPRSRCRFWMRWCPPPRPAKDRGRAEDAAGRDRDGARRRRFVGGGAGKHYWSPVKEGADFDFSLSLSPLEPFRDYITVISDTDLANAESAAAPEVGGDHNRSSAVFLTASHPKRTEGSDIFAGVSMDQIYAQKFGQDTALPSMQLCIENVGSISGACGYGYSCVYSTAISWASPTMPFPSERDPRVAFERLFGHGATEAERTTRRRQDLSSSTPSGTGSPASKGARTRRPPQADRISRRHRRNRTAAAECRETESQRRGAEPAGRADRRARLLRRARQADVRPAGAGVRHRGHPGLELQDGARRQRARVPRERRHHAVPRPVAPRRQVRRRSRSSPGSTATTSASPPISSTS